jgi:hypothetical protein
LENESLYYVEGQYIPQKDMMSKEEFIDEHNNEENWENFSSADYIEEYDEVYDKLEERKIEAPGFFEKKTYFNKIFPSLKIQKPGTDLYGSTTFTLSLLTAFVFIFYARYTVSPDVFTFVKGQSSIFKGEMAVTICFLLLIIIVERYANRTDTKHVEEKRQRLSKLPK